MENLEKKTLMSRLKNQAKKHPWILPIFVAANLAYAPFSVAWKVYVGHKIYGYLKHPREMNVSSNNSSVRTYYSRVENMDFRNSKRNRVEIATNYRIQYPRCGSAE